jgi:hypothetical protein
MMEMTELLNETVNGGHAAPNHLSDEQRNIFNTKFTSLFSERLTSDVRRDIREQLHNQMIKVTDDGHFKESKQYKKMDRDQPEFTEKLI